MVKCTVSVCGWEGLLGARWREREGEEFNGGPGGGGGGNLGCLPELGYPRLVRSDTKPSKMHCSPIMSLLLSASWIRATTMSAAAPHLQPEKHLILLCAQRGSNTEDFFPALRCQISSVKQRLLDSEGQVWRRSSDSRKGRNTTQVMVVSLWFVLCVLLLYNRVALALFILRWEKQEVKRAEPEIQRFSDTKKKKETSENQQVKQSETLV